MAHGRVGLFECRLRRLELRSVRLLGGIRHVHSRLRRRDPWSGLVDGDPRLRVLELGIRAIDLDESIADTDRSADFHREASDVTLRLSAMMKHRGDRRVKL